MPSRDRPATRKKEIEVTPAMKDAGVLAFFENDEMFSSPEERVEPVYRAMCGARSKEGGNSSGLPGLTNLGALATLLSGALEERHCLL
jgi:hypothetical protein